MWNYRGARIATPGPAGTQHEGIFGMDPRGVPFVVENSKVHGRVVVSTLDEFSGRGNWEFVELAPAGSEDVIVGRALALQGKPYHVTGYNCQHFVSEVYTGEPASWQLREVGLVAGLVAFAAWATPEKKVRRKR